METWGSSKWRGNDLKPSLVVSKVTLPSRVLTAVVPTCQTYLYSNSIVNQGNLYKEKMQICWVWSQRYSIENTSAVVDHSASFFSCGWCNPRSNTQPWRAGEYISLIAWLDNKAGENINPQELGQWKKNLLEFILSIMNRVFGSSLELLLQAFSFNVIVFSGGTFRQGIH